MEHFAHEHHLSVVEASLDKWRVVLRGTAGNVSKAFGAQLAQYRNPALNNTFRGRSGILTMPAELQDSVIAVPGLDNRQQAFAHFIKSKQAPGSAGTFTLPPAKLSPIDASWLLIATVDIRPQVGHSGYRKNGADGPGLPS